jgi:predicted transcriptional regulator
VSVQCQYSTNTLHIDKKLCATKIIGGSPLTKKGCDISYKGSNVVLRNVNDEVLLKGKQMGGNFFYRAVVDHTKAATIKDKEFFTHE